MKRTIKLITIIVTLLCTIVISSCSKKGYKITPEGYIELSKSKKAEINANFKEFEHSISMIKQYSKYNPDFEFMDVFDCVAIFDDYYYFGYTGEIYGSPIPEVHFYYWDEYNFGGKHFTSTVILIYHNNVFSHNIEELFDFEMLDSNQLYKIIDTANNEFKNTNHWDYELIKSVMPNKIKDYDVKEFVQTEISQQDRERILNLVGNIKYLEENTCVGKKVVGNYRCYYFIRNKDLLDNFILDPVTYQYLGNVGIRMYSPAPICSILVHDNGGTNYGSMSCDPENPKKNYNNVENGDGRITDPGVRNYYFYYMEEEAFFMEIIDNVLALRVKTNTWPNGKGFSGMN